VEKDGEENAFGQEHLNGAVKQAIALIANQKVRERASSMTGARIWRS
jgi:hypothetical protein